MKIMVIRGNVVGGHRIADMGLWLEYGQEVEVPYDRATWSRDLTQALERGIVIRVAVTQKALAPPVPPSPNLDHPRRKPVPRGPVGIVTHKPEIRRSTGDSLNKELIKKLDAMAQAQKELLEKMAAILEGGMNAPAPAFSQPTSSPTSSSAKQEETRRKAQDDDPVIFIPSEIRSPTMKITDNVGEAVEADTKESGSLNEAAEALAKIKKKKRK